MLTRPNWTVTQHASALRVTTQEPSAVSVGEIADAGHYPHETAPAQLLSALQTFLAGTRPFRYDEGRFVQLLTAVDTVEARRAAASGHASSSDDLVRH